MESTGENRSGATEIGNQQAIYSISFVEGGKQVLSGGLKEILRRWQVDDGHPVGKGIQAGGPIYAAALSPDRKWLVCGLWGSMPHLKVWDAETHEKVLDILDHTDGVLSVDVSSDSTRFATGGRDKSAFIWSMATGERLVGPLQHDNHVLTVRFSPNGDRLATAAAEQSIQVFDSDDGQQLLVIPCPFKPLLSSPLAWSADGSQIFAVSFDEAKCLDASSGSLLGTWPVPGDTPFSSSSIALSREQTFIAVVANKSLSLWNTSTHKQIGPVIEHKSMVLSMALSPDGECIATGEENGTITLRSLRDIISGSYFIAHVTSQLPLMNIESDALQFWMQGNLTRVEELLTEETLCPQNPSRHAYALAHRALVRSRLKRYNLAIDDAAQSIKLQPTVVGHIAKAITLIEQKDHDVTMQAFDLVFRDCLPSEENCKFLLLIKAIVLFISGNIAIAMSRVQDLIATADNDAMYYCFQVLGNMYLKQGDYARAIESLERAQNIAPSQSSPHLITVSLIFGWNFDGLDITVQKHLFETLYSAGRMHEAAEALIRMVKNVDKEARTGNALAHWDSDFMQECIKKFETHGDEAMNAKKYDDAILHYTASLSLNPPGRVSLLVKRSKARAQKKMWESVLEDANEVIQLDPLYLWGYETKHAALLSLKQYDQALDAFRDMLSAIEGSPDKETRRLRQKYISPSQTESAIDSIIREIFKMCPLVLIDVETGHLCDGSERIRLFKSGVVFKELISSMTKKVDHDRILREVAKYFQYVTLSHVWQGREPSLQDVISVESIRNLDPSELTDKLRNFCKVAREDGYRWGWSDTCCIDKTISTVLNESLTLMYMWYEESAATLIYLATVASPSSLGDLAESIWMTRAWTLQELLAPKVIRIYDRDWKPYLNDQRTNHKESPEIMGELARAIQVPAETIAAFHPDSIGVREKLRLSSTRNATREEDVAYSLIGIFKSDVKPNYGDREKALGQLLEEIVTRSGEVTVLDWTGKSSLYNSCLPATLAVYKQAPRASPVIEDAEMNAQVATLQSQLSQVDAMLIHDRITHLPQARFASRRLYLPCMIFAIKRLSVQDIRNSQESHYRARVPGIGHVEFRTSDTLKEPRTLVLVHPWIRDLHDPLDRFGWESASDGESDSGVETGTESAPSSPSGAVLVSKVGYTRALRFLVRLRQPFCALLLQQQPNGEFRRVATENEIVVPGLERKINFAKDVRTEVLEVL